MQQTVLGRKRSLEYIYRKIEYTKFLSHLVFVRISRFTFVEKFIGNEIRCIEKYISMTAFVWHEIRIRRLTAPPLPKVGLESTCRKETRVASFFHELTWAMYELDVNQNDTKSTIWFLNRLLTRFCCPSRELPPWYDKQEILSYLERVLLFSHSYFRTRTTSKSTLHGPNCNRSLWAWL